MLIANYSVLVEQVQLILAYTETLCQPLIGIIWAPLKMNKKAFISFTYSIWLLPNHPELFYLFIFRI